MSYAICRTIKTQKDMKGNIIDYMEMAQNARYGIEKESDRLMAKLTQMEDYKKLLDGIDEVIADNKRQQEEIESLQQQLAEEKRQRAELEMNLMETRKLSDSVAKKSSEDGVVKALGTYVNRSKRKTSDKRAYIKNMILEFVSVNGLSLPEELSATIECLDDEQAEADKKDFISRLNPESLIIRRGYAEKVISEAETGTCFQFLRTGYFCKDPDSTPDFPVYNRTVGLRDTFSKQVK